MPVWALSLIIQKRCSIRWRSSGASSRKSGMIVSSMSAYMIAPWTFFEPEYSPRSSCRTLRPLLGQRVGGGVAGHAGADDDAIEFLDHGGSPSAGEPVARVRRQARAERFGQRRQKTDGVGRHGEMGEIEDRRVAGRC